jgi:protein SCO1
VLHAFFALASIWEIRVGARGARSGGNCWQLISGDDVSGRNRGLRTGHSRRGAAKAILSLAFILITGANIGAPAADRGIEAGKEHAQRLDIPDMKITNQDGRQVRFLSDVVRRRPAVVSFIFTGCSSTCPLVGATMAAVADRVQKDNLDSALVSISVDPENDTPAALLSWRAQFGDIPQWTLVTGPKSDIDRLLRAFRSYFADPEDHPDILMIGPDATGTWTRMSAPAPANDVISAIRAAAK